MPERVAEVLAVPAAVDDVARDGVGVLAGEPRADGLHRRQLRLEADVVGIARAAAGRSPVANVRVQSEQ